ncbi:hypothetical protein [Pelagovum pacificum]|uniref:Lipoprotein n=1 Tax=Pelagovum pacificum TaxID=2588711 RepID=A0A5C5GFW8_9RHOB|nr:hypothetical protein [Pelagovum pacificum]QQA43212.1 hypothetical protein I8N54_01170 [Pelagovum pacificum]TNY33648.1 hypothetical protein FHY64_10350 [Pelagovum pacificum]
MQRRAFLLGAPATLLTACGAAEPTWAPDEFLNPRIYAFDGPPMLTLFTMREEGGGQGAHTGLMINASQRVIFDPAGTFGHESIPERNDVHYGISPQVEEYYETYHARITYYLYRQDKVVPAPVAEQALRRAMTFGAVPKAQCARATSTILSELPGFESINVTWFPNALARQFDRLPGVTSRERHETDSDDKTIARAAFDEQVAE